MTNKWSRLRRWVTERERTERTLITSAHAGFRSEYHRHRNEVFKAVLLVMDAENRRDRRKVGSGNRAAYAERAQPTRRSAAK